MKAWLEIVRKKTTRLSTRITAKLGLISLTRDEEFEKHCQDFKHIEKTLKAFIKNLSAFVEHFEKFLLALQNTSEHLNDFYHDKSHQKELEELRRKNKALNCEHFHAFKRTIDRQVIAVSSQLLQKFSGPHQLINKRSAKLIDYDTRAKDMEACADLDKKPALRDQYVIAKDIYERINKQLIDELPVFNRLAIDIFRGCVLVLLDSRRNLIQAYTRQTASLLDTPLMLTYTASDVASSILMSCDLSKSGPPHKTTSRTSSVTNKSFDEIKRDTGTGTHNSTIDYETSRPHSSVSQGNSEFGELPQQQQQSIVAREIASSTPLSQVSEHQPLPTPPPPPPMDDEDHEEHPDDRYDVPDGVEEDLSGHIRKDDQLKTLPQCSSSFLNKTIYELESAKRSQQATKKKEETKRRKKKFQIYVASWPFLATGENQLTINCNQQLKLIKSSDECGNNEWSYVQNKKGEFGYVPSSYIRKKE